MITDGPDKNIRRNDAEEQKDRRGLAWARVAAALLIPLVIFLVIIAVKPLVSEPAAAPDVSDSPFAWEKQADSDAFEYRRPDADLPDIEPAKTPPSTAETEPETTTASTAETTEPSTDVSSSTATTAATTETAATGETQPASTTGKPDRTTSTAATGTGTNPDRTTRVTDPDITEPTGHDPEPTSRPTDPGEVIELPNDGKYFTTDIPDGATLDEPSLSFKIKHLKPEAVVESVSVQVNGIPVKQFSGRVDLGEGRNTIRVIARYRENGASVTAYDEYTVYYKPDAELTWETDLTDKIVTEKTFSFYVKVKGGTDKKKVQVIYGGRAIRPTGDTYTVTLKSGDENGTGRNLITVRIRDTVDGEEKTYLDRKYVITYRPETTEETKPRIRTINVSDRMEVLSNNFTVLMVAEDKDGNRLYADRIRLDVDGTVYPMTSQDWSYTGYQIQLKPGSNMLTIRLEDAAGREAEYRYELLRVNKEAKMTVQIEASTVGLGYIVAPVEYTITDGQKGSSVLKDILQQHGFTVRHQGSVDAGFYLAGIEKAGAFSGAAIPGDLLEYIKDDGLSINNSHSDDSLSEHHFTQGSGWLFQVNGYYPGFALSDYYPQDGDVLRLRYTVAYGKDVGQPAPGTGKYDIYPKEW